MLNGAGSTITQDHALYDSPAAHSGGVDKKYSHHAWRFAVQVSVLLWKECLHHVRRPWKLLLGLLLPALVVVLFGYAVILSPTAWIEPFVYTHTPEVTPHAVIPNESLIQLVWEKDMESVTNWRYVFDELNMTSFFIDYAVMVATLRRATNSLYEYDSVEWKTEEVSQTLLSNRYAAMPFKVPTLDAYINMIDAASVHIGKLGMKFTMVMDPLLYFIFHFGKLAFTVKNDKDLNLITAGVRLVEYLNVTTKSFKNTVLCPSQPVLAGNTSCLFHSVREVSKALSQQQQQHSKREETLWAIIQLEKISVHPTEFRYTIFINETLLQSSQTIEAFPQGLGKDYAMYAYNGVLTLQYELNTYFNSLAKHPGKRRNLSLTSLVDGICSTVQTTNNATQDMFEQPEETERQEYIKNASEEKPIQVLRSEPFLDVNAIYKPCLYEVDAFCSDSNDTTSLLKCLEDNSSKDNFSKICLAALKFVNKCLPLSSECQKINPYLLLTTNSSLLPQCATSLSSGCTEEDFINEVKQTKNVLKCSEDLKNVCYPGTASILFQCMGYPKEVAATLTNECRTVLESFLPCLDEYWSICPMGKLGKNGSIPYACLYNNKRIFSTKCQDTKFVKSILPSLFSQKAIREEIPASMYYCREVHDIHKTLQNSVVVEAFPANGYTQQMFFLTGGPFLGLVIAVAYYFPFVSTIQSIVHERESWKYKYLIIIGTHPLAIFLSKFLSNFIGSIMISLITTLSIVCFVDIPSSEVYSLLYMYSLSISALGMCLGQLIPSERMATLITPFIVFLFVTPALVGDQTSELKGASMLLPQTVLAKAFSQHTRVVQADFVEAVQTPSILQPLWILFGLTLFYSVIAILLEYIFLPNSPLERMLRRFTVWLRKMMNRLIRYGNRHAVRYYEGEEMSSRGGPLVSLEEEEEKNKNSRKSVIRESNLEFNIGGISNDPNKTLGREEHMDMVDISSERMSREEVGIANGETLASFMSPHPQESQVRRSSGITPKVPKSWRSTITARNLYTVSLAKHMQLQLPSADFYQNQLNCVVGGDTSGNSLLLEILMGWSDITRGEVKVDGRDIYLGNDADIGICLAKTVLWENLTVMENIRFIQMLKGRTSDYEELRKEASILFSALQLVSVTRELAHRLSSGMARKLAVAMALAGGSRTLLLDEPTLSTDPSSRTEIWHLLSQNAAGRCIVVSTSDVEEVDTFADHVTVLFGGGVTLAGTPEYIRQKLKGGWVVTVCRAVTTRVSVIIDRVLSIVPEAKVVSSVGREVSFRLTKNLTEDALNNLLTELQQTREAGLITNIIVSDIRLSEAFVQLTRVLDLQESQRGDVQTTTDENTAANGDYIMMPSSTGETAETLDPLNNNNNNNTSDAESQRNIPGLREDFEYLKNKRFITTYRAIVYYRALEAIFTPFYGLLLLMLPLVMIFFALSSLGATFSNRELSEIAVLNWQLSSNPSISFYSDFGKDSSPYEMLPNLLQDKMIPGTNSLFTNITHYGNLSKNDRSSVFMDRFLRENTTLQSFHFGAFVMQGPIITSSDETKYPAVFPWLTDVVLCNTSFPLSVPAYVEILTMMRLWVAENNTKGIISASLGPLGSIEEKEKEKKSISPLTTVDVINTLLLVLPFSFYGTRMVSGLVQQRYSGLLQVFRTSSLRPLAYWAANFTYDMLSFTILAFLVVSTYIFAGVNIDNNNNNGTSFFLIFGLIIVFGCGIISLSYLLSKCFDNPLSAQSTITGIGIFTGFSFLIASSAVRFLPSNPLTSEVKESNEVYSLWMRFLPHYYLGETFLSYSMRSVSYSSEVPPIFRVQPLLIFPLLFILLVIYESLIEMNVRIFIRDKIYLVIGKNIKRFGIYLRQFLNKDNTLLVEDSKVYRWEDPSGLIVCEDTSITNEREKGYTADGLHVEELWKLRHDVYALQNITVNVENETLVVVGINGSGKTTLLKCIVGDILPSYGSIFVNGSCCTGQNLSRLKANSDMGYSAESLIFEDSSMTPYLFLNIMADLRLMKCNATRKKHILYLLRTLGIYPYMHYGMRDLSLSLQRRVGLAAALIGYPSILLLDDVTSSLDPLSRRRVWAAIKSAPNGTAVVMSTRTPDDVEMLGDRVLLLDEGMMRYIGTPAEWREGYKKGFYVSIDVSRSHEPWTQRRPNYTGEEEEILCNFFSHYWNESILVESQPFHFVFHIPFYTYTKEELTEAEVMHTSNDSIPNTGKSSPHRNTVKSILATLIKGRNEDWLVEALHEEDANNNNSMRESRYSITVSETTIKHTAMTALGESISFQRSAQNLYNRSVYVPPRDCSASI
ncbi:putative ABC transporter [Trypanosoma theileri]|uniref:Putative ABC transporter n=1 Tax=Trypanosoma theileri TaxID=67003 RepID=A0A1X0NUI6_9TRYP|nr:putative ABC transporter [Trypanosoma theileri]ORC88374.1 putative ABC transporter [Trypanosoma theileri]